MAFANLREFIAHLEKQGSLRRVSAPVSRDLEIAEITDRVSKSAGGRNVALLFENVQGSEMPVLINAFGSPERMAAALGVGPLDELVGARGEAARPAHARLGVRQAAQARHALRRRQGRPQARELGRRARKWSRPSARRSPPCPCSAAGRATAAATSRCRWCSRAIPSPARATWACIASRSTTTRPSACTGRSTRARPSTSAWPRSGESPWRWPSRWAATRARSTRAPRPCRPASTRWSSRAGCAARACRWCRARRWTSTCRPRPRSCSRAGSIRPSGGSRARSAITPATTRWRATIRSST